MSEETLLPLKQKVRRLVLLAAGGKVDKDELSDGADLRDLGLDSLGYLNLLEGLDRAWGVDIDIDEEEDHTFLHTIDNLTHYLAQNGVTA